MIGTSHGPMGGERGPIEKILAAYQTHASNSLNGPDLSKTREQKTPTSYSNNFDLYNCYLQYQQKFLSPLWPESEDSLKGWPGPDFQSYFHNLSSQKADQHVAVMAQLYNYYQRYCHLIPTLPPHFPPYMPNLKPFQQSLYWPPPPQAFTPFLENNHHKSKLQDDFEAENTTNLGINSVPEKLTPEWHHLGSNGPHQPSSTLPNLLTTNLEGSSLPCFDVGGELRLCLPQLLNAVLGAFALRQINLACDRLHIYCSRCDADQLIVLKRARLLSLAAPDCGLITKTDAQRLCDYLLGGASPLPPQSREAARGVAPDSMGFDVYHECFGRCRGRVHPELYLTPTARCVECLECGTLLAPPQFVSHSHRPPERRVCHWGFDRDRWRSYLLVAPENTELTPSPPPDHVTETPESTELPSHHVISRPRISRVLTESSETKLKAFKEKFLDSQEDEINHVQHHTPNGPDKDLVSPVKPVKLGSHSSVLNLSTRPPPKKRARSGATFQPIDYSLNQRTSLTLSDRSIKRVKELENASSHSVDYFFSETNIPKCLTPLTTSSSSTLDDITPKSSSHPHQIRYFKSPPFAQPTNADDKLYVKQSSASLSFSRGEISKRKRFLSVPEGIHLTQDDKDATEEFLVKAKIPCDGYKFKHTSPSHKDAFESAEFFKDNTSFNCLKMVTSHFVELSKVLMFEIDEHAKKFASHSNPLVFDELKARTLSHLTLKHDALQSYLTQVFKS